STQFLAKPREKEAQHPLELLEDSGINRSRQGIQVCVPVKADLAARGVDECSAVGAGPTPKHAKACISEHLAQRVGAPETEMSGWFQSPPMSAEDTMSQTVQIWHRQDQVAAGGEEAIALLEEWVGVRDVLEDMVHRDGVERPFGELGLVESSNEDRELTVCVGHLGGLWVHLGSDHARS